MAALLAEYQWAFGQPQSRPRLAFYLGVHLSQSQGLSKTQGDRAELGALVPIGPYSLSVLEHLVATFSAEHCPTFMAERRSNLARIPRLSGLAEFRNRDGLSLFLNT